MISLFVVSGTCIAVVVLVTRAVQRNQAGFFPSGTRGSWLRPASIEAAGMAATLVILCQAVSIFFIRQRDIFLYEVFRHVQDVFVGLVISLFLHAYLRPLSRSVPQLRLLLASLFLIVIPHTLAVPVGLYLALAERDTLTQPPASTATDLDARLRLARLLNTASAGLCELSVLVFLLWAALAFSAALRDVGPRVVALQRLRSAEEENAAIVAASAAPVVVGRPPSVDVIGTRAGSASPGMAPAVVMTQQGWAAQKQLQAEYYERFGGGGGGGSGQAAYGGYGGGGGGYGLVHHGYGPAPGYVPAVGRSSGSPFGMAGTTGYGASPSAAGSAAGYAIGRDSSFGTEAGYGLPRGSGSPFGVAGATAYGAASSYGARSVYGSAPREALIFSGAGAGAGTPAPTGAWTGSASTLRASRSVDALSGAGGSAGSSSGGASGGFRRAEGGGGIGTEASVEPLDVVKWQLQEGTVRIIRRSIFWVAFAAVGVLVFDVSLLFLAERRGNTTEGHYFWLAQILVHYTLLGTGIFVIAVLFLLNLGKRQFQY
ncbi:hypothetical protein DFJ73DRAFT_762817 [Zopfochytrium polystomum]|nr:hypothetical protein DFJ73DRAFT_762817 [Zopfochytrium polystomum]